MRTKFRTEPLEQRLLLAATIVEHDDVAYIFADDAPRIDRYNIASENWLNPIQLSETAGGATGGWVDDDGIYVAQQSVLYRYDEGGGARTLIWNAPYAISAVFSDGDLVLAQSGSYHITSISKSTNTTLDSFETRAPYSASSILTGLNRIFGRHTYSPSDVMYVSYGDNGEFFESRESPYHGEIGLAYETWVTPDGAGVLDDSGLVFDSTTLRLKDSFASDIEDVVFQDSGDTLVLTEDRVVAFNSELLPTSEIAFSFAPERFFTNSVNLVTLTLDEGEASGYRADITPLAALQPPQAGATIDPVNLAYTPDDIQVANDGTLLLFSKQFESIFRWDPVAQRYVDSIRLLEPPRYFAYSGAENAIYVAYLSGLIRRIDLDIASPVETPFATTYLAPFALVAVGEYIFTDDNAMGHTTFAKDGTRADTQRSRDGTMYEWNEANQMLYYLDGSTSNNLRAEQINADGATYPGEPPGGIGEVIYEWQLTDLERRLPISVAPDGSVVVLGSGTICNARTLDELPTSLPYRFELATWIENKFYTLRRLDNLSQIQRWSGADFSPEAVAQFSGETHAFVTLPSDRLLTVQLDGAGIPRFRVFTSNLIEIPAPSGFTLDESFARTSVSESGASDHVTLALNSQPSSDVTILISSGNPDEVITEVAAVTFAPENWNVPQIVTLTGVDDENVDGTQTVELTFHVDIASSDVAFRESPPNQLLITNTDDDTPSNLTTDYDGVVYSFVRGGTWIDRYHLATSTWLPPLVTDEPVDGVAAALIDQDGIYVAIGQSVYHFNANATAFRHVTTMRDDVQAIFSDGELLFVVASTVVFGNELTFVTSINKSTNAIASASSYNAVQGSFSIAPQSNRLFARKNSSPSDIVFAEYLDDGTVVRWVESPYHGDFPYASRTWSYPDGQNVVDSSGTVYRASNLTWIDAFDAPIDDIVFLADSRPIVRRGDDLIEVDSDLFPQAEYSLPSTPLQMIGDGGGLLAVLSDAATVQGVRIEYVGLDEFVPIAPTAPDNPVGLAFRPDIVETTVHGDVLMLSKLHQAIFRWSATTQGYLPSIPLLGTPETMAYSAYGNVIYVAYENGFLWQLDLDDWQPSQQPFAKIAYRPIGLATAGSFVMVADSAGPYSTHYTFGEDGSLVDTSPLHYLSTDYVWSEANQKLYFFRDTPTPRALLWEEVNANGTTYPSLSPGEFGATRSTPFGISARSPIRISPDGDFVVLGNGEVYDARELARLSPISTFVDATWIGGDLIAIRNRGTTEVTRWTGGPLVAAETVIVAGAPIAVRSVSEDRLVVISVGQQGIPLYTVLNVALETQKLNIGDTDFDNIVGLNDLNNVRNYFGGSGYGDADGDGDIDLQDLNAVRNYFGASSEASHAMVAGVRLTVGGAIGSEASHPTKPLFHRERIPERELSFALAIQTNPQVSATDVLFDASFDFWRIKPRKIRPN